MDNLQAFSKSTVAALGYYVYLLVDNDTNKICYVGKGKGQRVFESLQFRSATHPRKLKPYIARHKLSEDEALLIEATLIDLLPYFAYSDLPFNYQDGIENKEVGIVSAEEIENHYSAPTINAEDFKHNVLIVSVNRSVNAQDSLPTAVNLYECTRKAWRVNLDKVKQIDYVIAKRNGILEEIYKPTRWYPYLESNGEKRYAFEGNTIIDADIRELYINKRFDKRSWGSPITYIINKKPDNANQ